MFSCCSRCNDLACERLESGGAGFGFHDFGLLPHEIFVLPQNAPDLLEMGHALLTPGLRQAGMMFVAIGIMARQSCPTTCFALRTGAEPQVAKRRGLRSPRNPFQHH